MRNVLLTCVAFSIACPAPGQSPAATPERPPIVGVAHIGLYASDMSKAEEFYGHALGFAHFSLDKPGGGLMLNYYKVNDHQYIEVYPKPEATPTRLSHIAFETTDAHKLRDYLEAKGVKVPATLKPGLDKNFSFMIKDAEGRDVEFVEYVKGGLHASKFGTLLPGTRVSDHMIHVGMTIADRSAADHLYKDVLGFKLMWYGGMKDDQTNWVDMRVPEGSNWLEYMLNVNNPTAKTLGVMNHLALGVKSIQPAYQAVLSHAYQPAQPPKIGRDGKWQLNLYDPDLTRAELMELEPVETPCCSPMILPTP